VLLVGGDRSHCNLSQARLSKTPSLEEYKNRQPVDNLPAGSPPGESISLKMHFIGKKNLINSAPKTKGWEPQPPPRDVRAEP
jgi:hypothetical protein